MTCMPVVSVVIPTYNREIELKQTITELLGQHFHDFEVIVVDNSSTDNTASMVADLAAQSTISVHYFRKPANGPASARNFGLARARAPLVLFLDSDVRLRQDWLQVALDYMEAHPEITGLGGLIIYDFDHARVNAFGGDIGYFGLAWDVGEDSDRRQWNTPEQRIWINCSAMLVKAASLNRVGGFDERYFYGYEDSDIGWKLNICGEQLWVHPELIAYHKVQPQPGGSNSIIVRHYCKNRLASLLQNGGFPGFPARIFAFIGFSLVDIVVRPNRRAKLQAIVWNIKELPVTLRQRGAMQSLRKQSDTQIFALGERRWFPPTPLSGNRRRPIAHDGGQTIATVADADDRV